MPTHIACAWRDLLSMKIPAANRVLEGITPKVSPVDGVGTALWMGALHEGQPFYTTANRSFTCGLLQDARFDLVAVFWSYQTPITIIAAPGGEVPALRLNSTYRYSVTTSKHMSAVRGMTGKDHVIDYCGHVGDGMLTPEAIVNQKQEWFLSLLSGASRIRVASKFLMRANYLAEQYLEDKAELLPNPREVRALPSLHELVPDKVWAKFTGWRLQDPLNARRLQQLQSLIDGDE